jgi:hypothetical protein
MYSQDFLDYIVSLDQIGGMFKQLDRKYGKPNIENPKKMNGQYMLRNVIKFLAYHKQATCEEIAKEEFEKNIQTHRKLKSITDDIRKFIKNNLIFTRLVIEDGFKKVHNKQIITYSLTPVGILYAIYLFSNLQFGEGVKIFQGDSRKLGLSFIRNIAKEYSHVMSKVFGKFDYFEKIIGNKFEMTVVNAFEKLFDEPETSIPDETIMLSDFARYDFWSSELTTHSPDPLIAEQFSLLFYANLHSSIEDILRTRRFDKWAESKNQTEKISQELRNKDRQKAKQIWLEILNHDKKLKNWYYGFVKMALKSKKIEYDNLWWYKRELSQNSMND